MCGIAGIVHVDPARDVREEELRRMAAAVRHRGPDGFGLARGPGLGLVSTRLSIFDLDRGWQPMRGADGASLLVYNGEVFNHPELRRELERHGEEFRTTSDTEVLLRLLDREGVDALSRLNGQFAFAWWQPRPRRLTLVRDRFGVRPLHYAEVDGGGLAFASEAKALFASGLVAPRPNLVAVDEIFTFWGPLAPDTTFEGVRQLPPGSLLVWEDGRIVSARSWWEPSYERDDGDRPELAELLRDAVELRLRADIPVGTYLSGGLDSSLITALARRASPHELRTFSVAFRDPHFDERRYQEEVAAAIGTRHHVLEVGPEEIAGAFQDVVWHAETPLVRTAPVPLALLAAETRAQGITVVATGEGADELYWGYDLFKEVKLRHFCARDLGSAARLRLFDRLYPYLAGAGARRGETWQRFFLAAGPEDDPLFSHQTRYAARAAVRAFYRPEVAELVASADPLERLRAELPEAFGRWSDLERAAYLELRTLLAPYLMAAQGDRAAMAHGVEGRFPFLDHRVFEHSVRTPPHRKLAGLREKGELRRLARTLLPSRVAERPKQPYRAPETAPFFGASTPEWVEERLSPAAVRDVGIFDERSVAGLVRRCRSGRVTSHRESMALVSILSTQVWHAQFLGPAARPFPTEEGRAEVLIDHFPSLPTRETAHGRRRP